MSTLLLTCYIKHEPVNKPNLTQKNLPDVRFLAVQVNHPAEVHTGFCARNLSMPVACLHHDLKNSTCKAAL